MPSQPAVPPVCVPAAILWGHSTSLRPPFSPFSLQLFCTFSLFLAFLFLCGCWSPSLHICALQGLSVTNERHQKEHHSSIKNGRSKRTDGRPKREPHHRTIHRHGTVHGQKKKRLTIASSRWPRRIWKYGSDANQRTFMCQRKKVHGQRRRPWDVGNKEMHCTVAEPEKEEEKKQQNGINKKDKDH